MNGKQYRQVLNKNLVPSNRVLKLKLGWIFQQENAPKTEQEILGIGLRR